MEPGRHLSSSHGPPSSVNGDNEHHALLPIDADTLTVATYNAEWLFDGINDKHRSWTTADDHIEDVGRVIASLEADVINVVELEDCNVLERVAVPVERKLNDDMVVYAPNGTDSGSGQTLGVISRWSFNDPGLKRSEQRVRYPLPGSMCGYSGVPKSTGVSKHYLGLLRCD